MQSILRFVDPRFADKIRFVATRFVDGFLVHEKSTNRVRQGLQKKIKIFISHEILLP